MPEEAVRAQALMGPVNKYVVTTTNMLNLTAAEAEAQLMDVNRT